MVFSLGVLSLSVYEIGSILFSDTTYWNDEMSSHWFSVIWVISMLICGFIGFFGALTLEKELIKRSSLIASVILAPLTPHMIFIA